jgi:hypothetical protein
METNIIREHPTLQQVDNFIRHASEDEHLKDLNWQNERIGEMTTKQFGYVKYLWINNNYFKLKEILNKFIK